MNDNRLRRWEFWIDVGGTFTDCIARSPSGELVRRKVLSSATCAGRVGSGSSSDRIIDSQRRLEPINFWQGCRLALIGPSGEVLAESLVQEQTTDGVLVLQSGLTSSPRIGQKYLLFAPVEAPLVAIRLILGLPFGETIPPCLVRLGTTKGTNALLTRSGAVTAFVTTRGFGDLLHIGYQNRPDLFALAIKKPTPLFTVAAEIEERLAADGSVVLPLDESSSRQALRTLREKGIQSLAICLMHASENPMHEERLAELAYEVGFTDIYLSSQIARRRKIVPRADTTVVDAYLSPVLRDYIANLAANLPGSQLRLMTSAGGLVPTADFSGKDSILSGPAGGVVGMSRSALAVGCSRAIGFDMGGTSTDVARFDGQFDYEFETEKAGVRIVAPMLAIETVAAGGGSICRFDGTRLMVGPASAGADPGPACYGRGGPLTVTDLNLFLGRLEESHFPFPLDRSAVERRLVELADEVAAVTKEIETLEALALGLIEIANATMLRTIHSISVAKGYDPRDYLLVAFGGASGQHACAVAEQLGVRRVLVPPDASLLSALGAGLADRVLYRARDVHQPLAKLALENLRAEWHSLAENAREELRRDGCEESRIGVRTLIELRYSGVDAALTIEVPETDNFDITAAFTAEHRRRFGYVQRDRAVEVVRLLVEVTGKSENTLPSSYFQKTEAPVAASERPVYFADGWQNTPIYQREQLRPGCTVQGPAVIVEEFTSTLVPSHWQADVWSRGELMLSFTPTSKSASQVTSTTTSDTSDPITLELFNNRFTSIAEQMGHTLRNTAGSVNVKERLDFSCAVFTADGDLVVNAPHIPVHLGAMAETVRSVIADNPSMCDGDVFVTNDPYRGGSHLPDVTVITPVFVGGAAVPIFFVASRAHHAEIGGITPGSMPPFSRCLAEEGVLIRNFAVIKQGEPRLAELRQLLTMAPYPSRAVEENIADISAQIAANQRGAQGLQELVARHSTDQVVAYMRHIRSAAEQKMRQTFARLKPGPRKFVDHLDDGTPIAVTVIIEGDSATIDFHGTGPVLATNLNANRAITTAAVMYVLRLLIGEPLPLNQGVLAPVKLILPECLLNPPADADPSRCAAIVGGNVETSQRVVDVLLGAFGLAAASQGTMNNLLFGDASFGYYETICGGSGATASSAGADAVHTHMTNTRLTDPEILEHRYPVRLRRFKIRRGSGGSGTHSGGDGVIREIEFLRPLTLSLLTQRRGPYPPYGVAGGQSGAIGRNILISRESSRDLPSSVQMNVSAGDVLRIETPGGGGWGNSAEDSQ